MGNVTKFPTKEKPKGVHVMGCHECKGEHWLVLLDDDDNQIGLQCVDCGFMPILADPQNDNA